MSDLQSDPQHLRLVEALIFAAVKPLEENDLAKRLPEDVDVPTVLGDLQLLYAERGVHLVKRGDGWAFRTAPDLGAILGKETVVSRKLPRAAAETLAILAYQKGGQGVTRAEIEEIRGVSVSQGTLDMLFEAGWVKPMGRKEAPGRPMLWGTTEVFLDHFGLKSLEDLPGIDELKASGLLDTNPAIATYAARASDEAVPGEEPVEPLGEGEEDAPVRAAPVNGEGIEEEILEGAALADAMLDTPEAESDEDEDDSDDEDDEDSGDDDSDEDEADEAPAKEAAKDESADEDDDSDDESDDDEPDEDEDEDGDSEDEDDDFDDEDDDFDGEDDDDDDDDEDDESEDEKDSEAASAAAKEEN